MKRDRYTVDMDWQESRARLDHYNKWLLDPTRPLGSGTYPGYHAEKKTEQKVPVSNETVAQKPKKSHNHRIVNKIMKGSEVKETKLSIATRIVSQTPSKELALSEIMNVLGVTKSNAFVYFTKATKALGTAVAAPKVEKASKAVKPAKANAVTGTSPTKAKAKVAEIDAVIAGLKASGATVASPFAGLGA